MTSQDYTLITKILQTVKPGPEKVEIVTKLGIAFQAQNPRFNYNKFRTACGIGQ